jgi:hypothetical protein
VPKRTKVAKKTCIEIPILRTTSGGGAEKYNHSAETEKIGAETDKIQSAEKVPKRVATDAAPQRILPPVQNPPICHSPQGQWPHSDLLLVLRSQVKGKVHRERQSALS